VAHQVRWAAEEGVCPRLHLSSAGDHPGAGDLSVDHTSAVSQRRRASVRHTIAKPSADVELLICPMRGRWR